MKASLHLLLLLTIGLFLSFKSTLSATNGDRNQKTLCGKVIDQATGEELTGVKIQIKGTDNFCYSDLNGNYVLIVSIDKEPEIVADALGYKQTILSATNLGFNVNINLSPLN